MAQSVESPPDTASVTSGDLAKRMEMARDYWNDYFEKELETVQEDHFEWLVGWEELKHVLLPYLEPHYKILIIGCGSSRLGIDLYLAGYTHITNMDISEKVIERMKETFAEYPEVRWLAGDVLNMTSAKAGSYDVILDKACMDTLLFRHPKKFHTNLINAMTKELKRVLTTSDIVVPQLKEHREPRSFPWLFSKSINFSQP